MGVVQSSKVEFVKNEDLSREIHEVTARPISHGHDPYFFRACPLFPQALYAIVKHKVPVPFFFFFSNEASLVFKGGTCLSKVHVDFHRLSEDLDLIIKFIHLTNFRPRKK